MEGVMRFAASIKMPNVFSHPAWTINFVLIYN